MAPMGTGWVRALLPWAQSHLPSSTPSPLERTSPSGPGGHESLEAFLLEDDTAANEEAGQEGKAQANVKAIGLPEPLPPAAAGGIAGHLGAEAADDLAQDFMGRAVEVDEGAWVEEYRNLDTGLSPASQILQLAPLADPMLLLSPGCPWAPS